MAQRPRDVRRLDVRLYADGREVGSGLAFLAGTAIAYPLANAAGGFGDYATASAASRSRARSTPPDLERGASGRQVLDDRAGTLQPLRPYSGAQTGVCCTRRPHPRHVMSDFFRRLTQTILELLRRWFGGPLKPPLPPPAGCPISWQPSIMAPVFYGVRDYGADDGAPGSVRVFLPSLDGAVFDAPILAGCGRYPLILFAHGQCSEPGVDHHQKWFELPAQLARSGYVVVVPALPRTAGGAYPWDNDAELGLLLETVEWMRTGWDHAGVRRRRLRPGPSVTHTVPCWPFASPPERHWRRTRR